ncbi:hypothetical protein [Neisseria polysaccharea]|uniref:hypothetical protein n=1 Tax=Neisseria polysaccharea TaxID=489 RepID=UPI0009DAAA68
MQVAVDVEAGVVFSAEGFGCNGNNAAYTASDGIQAQSGAHYPALPLKEGVEAEKNIGKYRLKYVQTAFAYWDGFGQLRKISVLTACSGRKSKRRRQVFPVHMVARDFIDGCAGCSCRRASVPNVGRWR